MTQPKKAQQKGGKRFYTWNDESYWSVTTIINGGLPKPVLVNWAKKFTSEYAVHNIEKLNVLLEPVDGEVDEGAAIDWLKGAAFRDRDKQAELGSDLHAAVEAYKLGQPMPDWSPLVKPRMFQFERFLGDYNPEVLLAEASVYNRTERYAGTLDNISLIDGRRCLVDYKGGRGVYPEVGLQLAAYRFAEFIGLPDGSEREMEPVDFCAVLHIKDDDYDFIEVQADMQMFQHFLYCRENYRFLNDVSKFVLRDTVKPPSLGEGDPVAAHAASEAQVDDQGESSSPSPSDGQTTLLPEGPRTREQEETLGVDIFGEPKEN